MKEFSQWVSDMSGTIEDKSEFIRPSHNQQPLTDLQKRLHMADLLVPDTSTEDKIQEWMDAFTAMFQDGKLYSIHLLAIVGHDISREYYATDGYSASKAWLNNFKQNILLGKLK